MRILTVSDVVPDELYKKFDRSAFPEIDLILACGDLPPEYLSFLYEAFNVPLYYVLGNHDIRSDSYPPGGCIDIHGRIVSFKGIKIMGLGGSRWYNGGPNQFTEREMVSILRRMRFSIWRKKGIDIVITHAPPLDIHDARDPCHKGFAAFRRVISKYSPKYFIHGHIHKLFTDPRERITAVTQTEVINTYGYHIIEIVHSQTD